MVNRILDEYNGGGLGELWERNYFTAVKFGYALLMIICIIMNIKGRSANYALIFIMAAACASIMGIYETVKYKKILLAFEFAAVLCGMYLCGNEFIVLLPVAISDAIAEFGLPQYMWLTPLLCVIFAQDKFMYLLLCLLTAIIYYQHYGMIMKYRKSADDYEQHELQLKDSIDSSAQEFKNEIRRTNLHYENVMLQDKAKLSQELHDKLGHRINGSIYQLEACRAIVSTAPEKTDEILSRVIESLRTGMDEIRALLRREKPDGKRLAMLQLIALCEDCRRQYGIDAQLDIKGDSDKIDEQAWGVLLNNCCEAVTNALKYSRCSKILIEINVLNKLLRCCISDNGCGCESISDGMGIQGMKRRVGKLGGTIDIDGTDGFKINMLIPIN